MILPEAKIEAKIRKHLTKKGWRIKDLPKTVGAHGADIRAWHPRWRKIYIIEAKEGSTRHPNQAMHNAFWAVLGQILTGMDIAGNQPNKARSYGIGIPKAWEKTFRNKIRKMKFGWTFLKLRVFLVDSEGKVEERPYSYFLK